MEDAGNQDSARLLTVEHDMPAVLKAAQAGTNILAKAAQSRIAGQHLATILQFAEVACGLGLAPFAEGIFADAQQIGLGAARKSKFRHGWLARCGKFERLTNAAKDVAPGHAAGIAFVDGAAQGVQSCGVLLLLALKLAQTGTDDFARVFVTPALYLCRHKTVQFWS